MTTATTKIIKFFEDSPGLHTLQELEAIGAYANLVRKLASHGELEEVARGIYRLATQEESEHSELAALALAIPQGVLCLISALDFHGIGTQRSFAHHISIPKGKRAPQRKDFTIRSYQRSGGAYSVGIETHGKIKVYSVAKTIADCFKFRNQIGLDIALEALKDVIRNKRTSVAELIEMAEICRVKKTMMPYLESLK